MTLSEENDGQNGTDVPRPLSGEEVVISGISGLFPNSDSVLDFMNNLYDKVDMVTSDEPKWKFNDPDLPKLMGTIKGADKFDAQFFGVSYRLACVLEPMGKKLLEHTFEAIVDSGTSPQSLRGKKVGVFIGSSYAEHCALFLFEVNHRSNFIINGGSKAMLANRISYWLDSKGPSYGLDCACSSSTACLEIAYNSIKSGECDAAIVGGCNFGVHPHLSLNLRRAGQLCLDGKTKCFDKNADGYVRADAINVIFLQKAKDAHRIYAQVYHAKGYYNMRPDGQFLPHRETEDIEKFLNEFYEETDVDPKQIEYVEAHGAAIAKSDENELNAISNIFAKDTPIKVGCVKSNMGNSEPASGVCAVTKLCLAYHKGKLPANLHYNDPNDQVPAVTDGRIEVVTEHADFNRGFTALNNFSYTGANFHIVLKGHYKKKNLQKYKCQIPHLVLASGRQEQTSVQKIFNILKTHPIDPEEIGLLHKVFENNIPGHTGRGYTILDTNQKNETVSIAESVNYYPGMKRPLWFVYSGMGSQWAGMGADLMKIPTFAAAINKCHKVLEPKGVDLIRIVTEPNNAIFDNILNAFVGIGAVQIGLTDIIKEMGIVPDNIIGHSLGEMACAYHDDTFTAEELILSTYSRGKVFLKTDLIKGSMAAVGVGYKTIVNQCPPEIDVACHNSNESSTISGPADKMKEFVDELQRRGIFAKEVPSANIAYHSRYIAHCGPELLRRLRNTIKNPKKRSNKWISTSVPQERWNEHNAVYSNAEYHTNNLLKPVLFEEMSRMIPDNAIVVEIAPHGLLQAILKRSHQKCTHIPLTRRGNTNGVKFLLEAFGKLYEAGINPKVDVLYPKIEFPVSTETPLLSHFVEWEHTETWPLLTYKENEEIRTATERNFIISPQDDDYNFLEGHIRDGTNVLPEAAVLVLVWETLSMHIGKNYKDQSIIFRNVQFHNEIILNPDVPLRLTIGINRGSNKFEVSQNDIVFASGTVNGATVTIFNNDTEYIESDDEKIILTSDDVYNILRSRGYFYKDKFQSIQSSILNRQKAFVQWNDDSNWVTFLDSLIQLTVLSRKHEGISTPKFIRKLKISVTEQKNLDTVEVNGVNCFAAQYNSIHGTVRCAGVELDNVRFIDKPVVQPKSEDLLIKDFYPYYSMDNVDLKTGLQIILQIVAENTTLKSIKATQIVTSNTNINCIIKDISNYVPNVTIDVASIINVNIDFDTLLVQNSDVNKANVFIIENLMEDEKKLKLLRNISKDSFVLAIESGVPKLQGLMNHFSVMTSMSDGKQILILLKRRNLMDVTYVNCDNKLDWVPRVYDELNKTKRVVLVSERLPYCGALGFVKKLRSNGIDKIGLVVIEDFHAPSFNPSTGIYKNQLEKNLAVNILRKGQWGGYYYTSAPKFTKLKHVTLTSLACDLDSFTWIEALTPAANNNLVQVSYAGISLKDVEKAVSNNSVDKKSFGMDFSGIDRHGDRVMGLVAGGALGSTVEADPTLLWPVPEHWSLQDAATVPLPYAIVYYCLAIRTRLTKRKTVFVTGGAGALGQAVIAVCLSMDCYVFTTVSNMQKKNLLLRLFPKLDENNIGYSRNDSCLNMIKTNATNKSCDFVINCTSGSVRENAMKCVGLTGFFLDLNFYDMSENRNIGMFFLEEDRSYRAIDFSGIFRSENSKEKQIIQQLITEGIANGTVRPITRVEYSPIEISRAFRLLSSSKQVGKVIIRMRSPEIMKQGFDVEPRMKYNSNGVYIVVCDENGIGIEVADSLVKNGARSIVLHTRSNISGYWQTKFVSWNEYSVTIKISTENLQTQNGCTKMLKEASKIGSIKGIFIVPDFEDKNNENALDFVQMFNKTALTVINLDLTSKNYCNELSHFTILTTSSQSASTEFSFAVLEGLCQARSKIGFPALIVRTDAFTGSSKKIPKNPKIILEPQVLKAFLNAMEKSLKLKYNNVLTNDPNKENTNNYWNKVVKIFGVTKIDNLQNDALVNDLKLNEVNLLELQALIRNIHKVDYSIEKIQCMTIESLKNIGNDTSANLKNHDGLGAFYTRVDDEEEHLATSYPIVPMITLLNNGTEIDLDPTKTYLTLIPGFEGLHKIFNAVAERLKVQAVAVQLAPDIEGNNIPEIAATVRKFMSTKFESKSKFYLLGYSFGVNVALEVAALLEKEGHSGVVYCLDSSPDALKIQLNSHLGELTESELQNVVLEHLYQLMTGRFSEELTQDLRQIKGWQTKVDACVYAMKALGNYSKQYKESIFESAYKRIMLARNYEPNFKLNSELVLIKGLPHPKSESLPEDYNLSKFTNKPVKIFNIESDHTSAPYDCRVSNIVNKMLDPTLLEEFKKKNLCETYAIKSK